MKTDFIQSMMPHALRVSDRLGIDPRIVIAQSALETGWGKSVPGNNYFGVKSHGRSGGNNVTTHEVINGQRVKINDSFRGYGDAGESADDYAQFLKENPRYSEMLSSKGLDAQIDALGRSGYATDPDYAKKIRSIASGIELPSALQAPPEVSTGFLSSDNQTATPIDNVLLSNDTATALGREKPYDMFGTEDNYRPLPTAPQLPPGMAEQLPMQNAGMAAPTQDAGVLTQGGALDQSNAAPKELSGIEKLLQKPEWLTQDRSELLLALGTGLLSGNDFASGMAAAGENILGVSQNRRSREDAANLRDEARQNELADNATAFDQDKELIGLRASTAASTASSYNRPFNVVGRDPETGQEVVTSGTMRDGIPYVERDGQLIPASSVMTDVRIGGRSDSQDVTAGAGGIPNAISVSVTGIPAFDYERDSEQKLYGYAIRAIGAHRDMDAMAEQVTDEQFTSLATTMKRWAAAGAEKGITSAAINSWFEDAGITGAYAATASAYLQAVLRADTGAAYTETEIADYAATFLPSAGNTSETLAQKRRLRERELMRFAAGTGAASTYVGELISGSRELPGGYFTPQSQSQPALSSSAPSDQDVEDILKGLGM